MGIRNLKPVTPGSRFASRSDFSELTTSSPEKSLTVALRKKGGRNNTGRITVRRRGGGHRRRYRIIDYRRNKFGIEVKLPLLNMILTDPLIFLWCIILMVRSVIFYLQ